MPPSEPKRVLVREVVERPTKDRAAVPAPVIQPPRKREPLPAGRKLVRG